MSEAFDKFCACPPRINDPTSVQDLKPVPGIGAKSQG